MTPEIVVRRFPTYDVVFAVSLAPGDARTRLERRFEESARTTVTATRSDSRASTGERLLVTAKRPWSPHPRLALRFVPSVAGTNVYLRMRVPPLWWALLIALLTLFLVAASWSFTLGEVLPGALIVLMFALAVLFRIGWSIRSVMRVIISALAD